MAEVTGDGPAVITFEMVEYFRQWDTVERSIVLRDYYHFLIPFPVFAAVYPDHKRRLPRRESPWPQVLRLLGGIVGVAIALQAIRALSGIAVVRSSFAINHTVMLLTFVLAVESLSRALCGLERLAGFDTAPIIRDAYLSRSVSEAWRQYNYRIHDLLYHNVVQATGGRRALIRSIVTLLDLFSAERSSPIPNAVPVAAEWYTGAHFGSFLWAS